MLLLTSQGGGGHPARRQPGGLLPVGHGRSPGPLPESSGEYPDGSVDRAGTGGYGTCGVDDEGSPRQQHPSGDDGAGTVDEVPQAAALDLGHLGP